MPKQNSKSPPPAASPLTGLPVADLVGRFFWARRGDTQRVLVLVLGDGAMPGWVRVRAFIETRRKWGPDFLSDRGALIAAPDPEADRYAVQVATKAASDDPELSAAIRRTTTVEA